jgi:hypothetical protein
VRRHVAALAAVAALAVSGCDHDDKLPEAKLCRGLVDVSDSAAFVQYSVRKDRYWDVTLAMLQNPCAYAVDVVGVELGAAMGITGQGTAVAPRPDQVFAAAAASPVALPPLEPFRVPAGSTVQVVGRFAVTGGEPVHVPTATLTFQDGEPGTLTLRPKVSLCTCGPPS